MKLRAVSMQLNQLDKQTLVDLCNGLFGIIAADSTTYHTVEKAIPVARHLAPYSTDFSQQIFFACKLLEQTNEDGVRQVIEDYKRVVSL